MAHQAGFVARWGPHSSTEKVASKLLTIKVLANFLLFFLSMGWFTFFFSDANLDVNVSMTKDSSLHFNVTAFVTAGIRMSTSTAQKQTKCQMQSHPSRSRISSWPECKHRILVQPSICFNLHLDCISSSEGLAELESHMDNTVTDAWSLWYKLWKEPKGLGFLDWIWGCHPRCILIIQQNLTMYLENLVYHFFRQLWLVLGVKLMEINSNWFSRY